jgi:hypothetical protein
MADARALQMIGYVFAATTATAMFIAAALTLNGVAA